MTKYQIGEVVRTDWPNEMLYGEIRGIDCGVYYGDLENPYYFVFKSVICSKDGLGQPIKTITGAWVKESSIKPLGQTA